MLLPSLLQLTSLSALSYYVGNVSLSSSKPPAMRAYTTLFVTLAVSAHYTIRILVLCRQLLASLVYTARFAGLTTLPVTLAVPAHDTIRFIILCRHASLRYTMYPYYVDRHASLYAVPVRLASLYDVPVLCRYTLFHYVICPYYADTPDWRVCAMPARLACMMHPHYVGTLRYTMMYPYYALTSLYDVPVLCRHVLLRYKMCPYYVGTMSTRLVTLAYTACSSRSQHYSPYRTMRARLPSLYEAPLLCRTL